MKLREFAERHYRTALWLPDGTGWTFPAFAPDLSSSKSRPLKHQAPKHAVVLTTDCRLEVCRNTCGPMRSLRPPRAGLGCVYSAFFEPNGHACPMR